MNTSKQDREGIKNYKDLVNEFKDLLEAKGFVSMLSGLITDPIKINGSSDFIERQFVADYISRDRKNPFTREPMTLADLNAIKTDEATQAEIENLITDFLQRHQTHPDFEAIKAAIEEEKYKSEALPAATAATGPRQPADPSEDDMVAIAAAQRDLQRNAPAPGAANPAPNAPPAINNPGPVLPRRHNLFQQQPNIPSDSAIHLPRGFTIYVAPGANDRLNQVNASINMLNMGYDGSPSLYNACIKPQDRRVIGADFFTVNMQDMNARVWDMAGMERFSSQIRSIINRVDMVMYFGDDESVNRGFELASGKAHAHHFAITYGADLSLLITPVTDAQRITAAPERIVDYRRPDTNRAQIENFSDRLLHMSRDAFAAPNVVRQEDVDQGHRPN